MQRHWSSAPQACHRAVSPRRVPVRTCVGCRTRAHATELLRVVVVDGALVPDGKRRLPGRGAWIHPVPECLRNAERRRAFPRALRTSGPLRTAGVLDYLERQLPEQWLTQSPTRRQVDPS